MIDGVKKYIARSGKYIVFIWAMNKRNAKKSAYRIFNKNIKPTKYTKIKVELAGAE